MANPLWMHLFLRTLWGAALSAVCLVLTLAAWPTAAGAPPVSAGFDWTREAGQELRSWAQDQDGRLFGNVSGNFVIGPLVGRQTRGDSGRGAPRASEPESGRLTTYLVGIAGLLLVQYAGVRRMRAALASLASLPENKE
jgi:hypothetical protein